MNYIFNKQDKIMFKIVTSVENNEMMNIRYT